MTALDRALGVVVAAAATLAIAWASHAPMTVNRSSDAVLRLAWSARPDRVEECRRPSEAEQANLPRHMRQQLICEGTTAAYRLVVRRGDSIIAEEVVRGGGMRHDRRLYVFRELPLPRGDASISVQFDRLDPAASSVSHNDGDDGVPDPRAGERTARTSAGSEIRGREETRRLQQHRDAVPPHLSFEQRLRFSPRTAILVTYDPDRRALVAVHHDRR